MMQGETLPVQEEQRGRIEQEVAAIENSAAFVRSPVMRRLLQFVVGETLAGRGAQIKAYTVAVDGLGRPSDFDAQQDSYPRVQIGRLRKALEAYYASSPSVTGLRLELHSGSYRIHFIETGNAVGPLIGDRGSRFRSPFARFRSLLGQGGSQSGVFVVGAVLFFILFVFLGSSMGWFAPWGERVRLSGSGGVIPLIEVQPVMPVDSGAQEIAAAGYLTDRVRHAIRHSGWAQLRSDIHPMSYRPAPEADYLLRGRIAVMPSRNTVLAMELMDIDEDAVVWSKSVMLSAPKDQKTLVENGPLLDSYLTSLISTAVGPQGVIARRERRGS